MRRAPGDPRPARTPSREDTANSVRTEWSVHPMRREAVASYVLLATDSRGGPSKGCPMYARVVTFHLDGLTPSDFKAHAAEVAPVFTTWPGLLAKVWIADEEANTFGGIYLFADRASADRSR